MVGCGTVDVESDFRLVSRRQIIVICRNSALGSISCARLLGFPAYSTRNELGGLRTRVLYDT